MPKHPFLGAFVGSITNLISVDPVTKERSFAGSALSILRTRQSPRQSPRLDWAHSEKSLVQTKREGHSPGAVQHTHNGETKVARATREYFFKAIRDHNTIKVSD